MYIIIIIIIITIIIIILLLLLLLFIKEAISHKVVFRTALYGAGKIL